MLVTSQHSSPRVVEGGVGGEDLVESHGFQGGTEGRSVVANR